MIICICLFATVACGSLKNNDYKAKELNRYALHYFDIEQYDTALSLFWQAIAMPGVNDPMRGSIIRNLAQVYYELEQVDSAIYYSKQAAGYYDEGSFEHLINLADVDLYSNDTRNALEKLEKAYAIDATDLSVNNALGLIYMGNYGDAFTDFKKALPYNQTAYDERQDRISEMVLAQNYVDLGDYAAAEQHYRNIYDGYDFLAESPYYLGLVMHYQGDTLAATQYFKETMAIDPNYRLAIPVAYLPYLDAANPAQE